MTVLPTVRRQLQEAAERQASRATARTRARFFPEPIAGVMRVVFGTAAVGVALGFAALLLVLLRHHPPSSPTTGHSSAPARACSPSSAPTCRGGAYTHLSPQRLLYGNGVGNIHFGQTATKADAELTRLLGPPGAKYVVISSCGFDHYSQWDGLDVRSAGVARGHPYFRAQLTIFFNRSRFVGYSYTNNHFIARGAPWSEVSYPLDSSYAQQVLHGPRLTLATARGLVLGDAIARARRLYGQAFRETTGEQRAPRSAGRASRLPVWEASTPSGRIGGGIYTRTEGGSFYASARPGIWWISAGEGAPTTLCH